MISIYIIEKEILDGVELLPDITASPIWSDYDKLKPSKSIQTIAMLYMAIAERENYYQYNKATAFGDPQYRYHCGVVHGMLQVSGMKEELQENKIIITKGTRTKMIIDKVKKSQLYMTSKEENMQLIKKLGI